MTSITSFSVAELCGLARHGDLGETIGVAAGMPVVLVENPADSPVDENAGPHVGCIELLRAEIATLPCVLLAFPGVDPGVTSLADVLPDPEHLDAVIATVLGNPIAATTLAMLLRGGEARSVGAGLVAESFAYSALQAGTEFHAWRQGTPVRTAAETPTGAPVLMQRRDDTLTITFDRPGRHNAFDTPTRDALIDALLVAVADDSLRVVLRGNGPSFCSGGDLDEFGSRSDPASAHVIRLSRSAARLVARLSPRLVVEVHGACLGSGIELAAFAGHVRAHPATRFALPEVSLGLIPGAGGTVSLPRRIGRHRTALLALMGTTIDATTALAWGLIDEIGQP